jgi:hypothetical protein
MLTARKEGSQMSKTFNRTRISTPAPARRTVFVWKRDRFWFWDDCEREMGDLDGIANGPFRSEACARNDAKRVHPAAKCVSRSQQRAERSPRDGGDVVCEAPSMEMV